MRQLLIVGSLTAIVGGSFVRSFSVASASFYAASDVRLVNSAAPISAQEIADFLGIMTTGFSVKTSQPIELSFSSESFERGESNGIRPMGRLKLQKPSQLNLLISIEGSVVRTRMSADEGAVSLGSVTDDLGNLNLFRARASSRPAEVRLASDSPSLIYSLFMNHDQVTAPDVQNRTTEALKQTAKGYDRAVLIYCQLTHPDGKD